MRELREEIRVRTLEGLKETTPRALAWLDDVIEQRSSAKDADALARALHAIEKISSSASGELREPKPVQKKEIQIVFADWIVAAMRGDT